MSLPIVNFRLKMHVDNRWWKFKEMYGKVNRGKMVQLRAGESILCQWNSRKLVAVDCGQYVWDLDRNYKP